MRGVNETKEDTVLSAMANAADAAAQGRPVGGAPQHELTSEILLDSVLDLLSENKADEVVQIDLRGKTAVCDYMVICSGRSSRQVAAISDKLVEGLKAAHGVMSRIEGKETGDWVLIDSGDIVVHVFRPEVREFYQLEKMWMPTGEQA